jgi:hypothetical protein
MWDEDTQQWIRAGEADAVQMWLVYDRSPQDPDVAAAIEAQLGEDAIFCPVVRQRGRLSQHTAAPCARVTRHVPPVQS